MARPLRFYELGSDSILEWHEPGADSAVREFRLLRTLQHRIDAGPMLPPALFVFHCGRCGSTLLGRLLEVDIANRVCLEPNALLQFFELNEHRLDSPSARTDFQTLVHSYGLAPGAGERRLMIKFSSTNVRHLEFVRACFPEVPFVYLLREPAAVIASNLRNTPLFLEVAGRAKLARAFGGTERPLGDYSLAEWCGWYVDRNLRWARHHAHFFQQVIDYRDCRDRYRTVLNAFSPAPKEMTDPAIAAVFSRHSKRREEKFTTEADERILTPPLQAMAHAAAGESYQSWREFLAGPPGRPETGSGKRA